MPGLAEPRGEGRNAPADRRVNGSWPPRESRSRNVGFASTRVADIVGLAGTSHGTFYTYFEDKRDVLLALTQEAASAIYGAAVAPLADSKQQSPRDASAPG